MAAARDTSKATRRVTAGKATVGRSARSGALQEGAQVGRRGRSTPADDPLSSSRVRYLMDAFGGQALAILTGVSASQPTRWSAGDERPGATAAPLLIDLEHVLAKARLIWGEQAAQQWLVSASSYLGGARPLDALRVHGSSAVLDALDGEMWGGAA